MTLRLGKIVLQFVSEIFNMQEHIGAGGMIRVLFQQIVDLPVLLCKFRQGVLRHRSGQPCPFHQAETSHIRFSAGLPAASTTSL